MLVGHPFQLFDFQQTRHPMLMLRGVIFEELSGLCSSVCPLSH